MTPSAFFAHATRTATYKTDNDDAAFFERFEDGRVLAGLFDGVTIPKRNYRTGHVVSTFLRERLRETLGGDGQVRPAVEEALLDAMHESVSVLQKVGGGAGTTATVVVAAPQPSGFWQLDIMNAGNSRATAFMPDGTIAPVTRIKPPGTTFAAVNTLSYGYPYKQEFSRAIAPPGTIALLTSDGIHDHLLDTDIWAELGRAIEKALAHSGEGDAPALVTQLTRFFVDSLIERAVEAQARARRSDDATVLAIMLGDPVEPLAGKRLGASLPYQTR